MSWTDKKISLPFLGGNSDKSSSRGGGGASGHFSNAHPAEEALSAVDNDDHHHHSSSSHHHNEPPILMKAMLKKIKKNNHMIKRFFVLYDRTAETPAKLVYFDTEKKYLANRAAPKREIVLKSCLNINRKRDPKDARGQGFMGLDIYTPEDRLQISFDNREDELNEWLECLLILHKGASNFYGKKPQPNFEVIWQVSLKGFDPEAGNDTRPHHLTGAYRLGVTPEFIELFRLGEERGIKLHHQSIRKFMLNDKLKVLGLELGRTSPVGPGVLSIESDEKDGIQQIHDNLVKVMRCAASTKENIGIGRYRSSSLGQDRVSTTTSSSKSSTGSGLVVSGSSSSNAGGASHSMNASRHPHHGVGGSSRGVEMSRNRTISEPVDGAASGAAATSSVLGKLANMSLDSRNYRMSGMSGRGLQGIGSPTSPMGSTTGLSDGGTTGSSSSINDPILDFDTLVPAHPQHQQPEVIPEESSGEISIEFSHNSSSNVVDSSSFSHHHHNVPHHSRDSSISELATTPASSLPRKSVTPGTSTPTSSSSSHQHHRAPHVFHTKQPSLPDDAYMRMDMNTSFSSAGGGGGGATGMTPPALPARNQEFNLSTSLPTGGSVGGRLLHHSSAAGSHQHHNQHGGGGVGSHHQHSMHQQSYDQQQHGSSIASPTTTDSLSSEYPMPFGGLGGSSSSRPVPSSGGGGGGGSTQHSTPGLLSPAAEESSYLPMDQIAQMLSTPSPRVVANSSSSHQQQSNLLSQQSSPPTTCYNSNISTATNYSNTSSLSPPIRQGGGGGLLPSPLSLPQLEGLNTPPTTTTTTTLDLSGNNTSSSTLLQQQSSAESSSKLFGGFLGDTSEILPAAAAATTPPKAGSSGGGTGKVRIPSGEAGYVVMSPGVQINLDDSRTSGGDGDEPPASLAAIEEALGGRWHGGGSSTGIMSSSPFHNTSPLALRRGGGGGNTHEDISSTINSSKRNSSLLDETDTSFSWRLNEDLDFTTDDYTMDGGGGRGMSPTAPGGAYGGGSTDDYMLIEYPRHTGGLGISSSTPRPISRSSPASSMSSAMCAGGGGGGTPSSSVTTRMADMDRLEKVQSFLLMDQDDITPSTSADKQKTAGSSSSRPPRPGGGDHSSTTTSGRSSKSGYCIDIPSNTTMAAPSTSSKQRSGGGFHIGGKTPPSGSSHSGSPGVVSRLGGWFRNRAGSVPNRPQLNERRRHRTQSEGEKDAAVSTSNSASASSGPANNS